MAVLSLRRGSKGVRNVHVVLLQATAADQHDTNCVFEQRHHDEARHTRTRWNDERTVESFCGRVHGIQNPPRTMLSHVSSEDNGSSRAAVSSSNDPKPPCHNRSASDVAIHLYRSVCASFLTGTASFCLPSTTMIASQPSRFFWQRCGPSSVSLARDVLATCHRRAHHILNEFFTATRSTLEEVISAPASQRCCLATIASGTSMTIEATIRILRLDSDVKHHRRVTDE